MNEKLSKGIIGALIQAQGMNSLANYYQVPFKHRRLLLICTCAIALIGVLIAELMPKQYISNAKLLVRIGRENAETDPLTAASGTNAERLLSIGQTIENQVNNEVEILCSQAVAKDVVNKIGVNRILNKPDNALMLNPAKCMDEAVTMVMNKFGVQPIPKSAVIALSYKSQNSRLSQQVLDTLIKVYTDRHIFVYGSPMSYDFFTQQSGAFLKALDSTEDKIKTLKNAASISTIEERRTAISQRISSIQLDIEQTSAALALSEGRIASMRAQLTSLETSKDVLRPAPDKQSSEDAMRQQLNELKIREKELLAKYTEKNQLVIDIHKQIKEVSDLLNQEEISQTVGRSIGDIQQNIIQEQVNTEGLAAKAKSLSSLLYQAQNELRWINNSDIALSSLQRKKEISEINYRKYIDNLEQSRIGDELQMKKVSNISIVQPPTYPFLPSSPHKGRIIVCSLFFGFFIGITGSFVVEYRRQYNNI